MLSPSSPPMPPSSFLSSSLEWGGGDQGGQCHQGRRDKSTTNNDGQIWCRHCHRGHRLSRGREGRGGEDRDAATAAPVFVNGRRRENNNEDNERHTTINYLTGKEGAALMTVAGSHYAGGRLRMVDGGWRTANGGRWMADGGWQMVGSERGTVDSGQRGRRTADDGWRPVDGGRWMAELSGSIPWLCAWRTRGLSARGGANCRDNDKIAKKNYCIFFIFESGDPKINMSIR